jgi:FkbM family methyltransferase
VIATLARHLPQPARRALYGFSRRFIDACDGANDPDMITNGEARLLREMIPQCRVVFDVGANVGDWAEIALACNPAIELHCFEPSPATFERLMTRSFAPRLKANPFGLSSSSGAADLHVFAAASGMNSLYRRSGLDDRGIASPATSERVELETLDGYCAEHGIDSIDFLKLDVEGHELHVLRGAARALSAGRIGAVAFEYGGCNIDAHVLLKDIFELAAGWPYEFFRILPDGLRPVPAYRQALEDFRYSNWLMRRRGRPA